ncbi:hypothetical protein [Dactylosporangium sp. CA-139066]|uniref:hypothetical protein n=1 Tax=Dactylosporangium sp. CA-139066 TaxID=3239930 RepID=UPI003D8A9729
MDKPWGAGRDALLAYAAGAVGATANLALIAFYALQANHPERGDSLGVANDLIGAFGSALLIPVTLGLRRHLPRRRTVNLTQAIGVTAGAVLTLTSLLLVFGAVPFTVATPISLIAYLLFAAWLLLVNRWLRQSQALRGPFRLGQYLGAAAIAGAAIAGLGALPPAMSWPRLAVFATGGMLFGIAILGTPIWLLLLGRALTNTADATRPAHIHETGQPAHESGLVP